MNSFELPIALQENKQITDSHLINDIGLRDNDSLYTTIFDSSSNNSNNIGKRTIHKWHTYYTTDTKFLKDSQRLLRRPLPSITWNTNEVEDVFHDISSYDNLNDNGAAFIAQYQYLEWDKLYFLNKNSKFLLWMSIYNMSSPVISLILPIILLFVPFIILCAHGMSVSLSNYMNILKQTFSKHQLGQIFMLDSSASLEKKGYVAVSTGFYLLQIYQNIRSCIQFWNNINLIQNKIYTVNKHVEHSIKVMKQFNNCCGDMNTHSVFYNNTMQHYNNLEKLQKEISAISNKKFTVKDVKTIGHIMKCFYLLYRDEDYKCSLQYSLDFCGYIDNLENLKRHIETKFLGKTTYSKTHTSFKKSFYPVVHNPVKNSYNLKKHILVTGPNAAGKTTILKATIFNVLLSQQIGYGCYKKATLTPFHKIHSYINIPDTSGRDSLFQAEARRCRDILTSIEENGPTSRHFCVFDELYSGTNPYEAIGSAAAFLQHLARNNNVSCMITTHFIGLCERLDKNKKFNNYHMKTTGTDDDFKYTYLFKKGISSTKGGVRVLRDLKYPKTIIDNTKQIIEKIII
mgnify:CR=1 FL=1